MAFELQDVVPWGRNLDEYRRMFRLSEEELRRSIASFGDGPASFNGEATALGAQVASYDPVYRFSRAELARRIDETCDVVMAQLMRNLENYHWTQISSPAELRELRMGAMRRFLDDFEPGRRAGRYVDHTLPDRVGLPDHTYELGLSSHFLLLYESLGLDFHLAALDEMLRLCREVRVFPICNLDGKATELAAKVIAHYRRLRTVEVVPTGYRFQKSTNELLIIR